MSLCLYYCLSYVMCESNIFCAVFSVIRVVSGSTVFVTLLHNDTIFAGN